MLTNCLSICILGAVITKFIFRVKGFEFQLILQCHPPRSESHYNGEILCLNENDSVSFDCPQHFNKRLDIVVQTFRRKT